MADTDYVLFERHLTRSKEIFEAAGVKTGTKDTYTNTLAAASARYLAAHAQVGVAEKSAGKERAEAIAALERIDQPYRVARSVAAAHVKDLPLGMTLKSLDTDTDKMNAISGLLGKLDELDEAHEWAKHQLEGDFGRLAPEALREIREWVTANAGLQKAQQSRAESFGPAWEAFVAFKDVVRQEYSPRSREYRRIHSRSSADDAEKTHPGTPPT